MIEENNVIVRVRIKKPESRYFGELGKIVGSNCNGEFRVIVFVEGKPNITLLPSEVEPC